MAFAQSVSSLRYRFAFIALGAAFLTNPAHSDASPSHSAEIHASELTTTQRLEIQTFLEKRVQACVRSQNRIGGQAPHIRVTVQFNLAGDNLLVNFGPGFVPKEPTLPFKVQLGEVVELIYWYMDNVARIDVPVYSFDGKDIAAYFPGASVIDLARETFQGQNPCRQRIDEEA